MAVGSSSYSGQRYSTLTQITPGNAKSLELKWAYQTLSPWAFEATPLVVDGVMYLTHGPNAPPTAAWRWLIKRCSWRPRMRT